jgi:hypothetical protein
VTTLWTQGNRALRRIARAVEAIARPPARAGLGLALSSVIGKDHLMSVRNVVPPVELVDVEKVLLSIAPKDADGQAVTDGPFTWTADNSANPEPVISLEPAADGLSCWAISGVPGVCTVHVTDGALEDMVTLTVKTVAVASLNLSAGTPVPETPAAS